MFERIAKSWELAKASGRVLQADKELLIFPVLSFIGVVLVTISFAVPTFAAGIFDSVVSGEDGPQVLGYVVAFLYYLVQYFVIFFANTALVGATMIRLRGGDPTVGDGFRIAMSHSKNIFGYALIAATVGMILRTLSERGGTFGRLASSLLGMGWNLATYLVVPVLVMEECSPVDAIKRSANLLKQTWGEQIVGNFGIGTVFGLMIFLAIIIGIPLVIVAAMLESVVLVFVVIAAVVLTIATLSLVNAALSGIYAAAVYRYATEGTPGAFFDEAVVANTFRAK